MRRLVSAQVLEKKHALELAIFSLFLFFLFFLVKTALTGAATFTFVQTNWGGGETVNVPVASLNNVGWDEYSSGAGVVTSSAGEVSLDITQGVIEETSDLDFDVGSQSDTDVRGIGDSAQLLLDNQNEQEVDTWNAPQPSLSTMNSGAALTYPGAGNHIYALRGGGNNNFYRYSLYSSSWSSVANIPEAVGLGGALVGVEDGESLFAFVGSTSTGFYRYSISSNSWSAMSSAPASISDGAALSYPGSGDYIYAFRGGDTTDFYRYSISNDLWESLSDVPIIVGRGGSLSKGDTVGTLFGLSGKFTTNFYSYNIPGDTWSVKADSPSFVARGASLVYPGSGDYVYALRGDNRDDFWRYSISGDSWETLSDTLNLVHSGGSLVYPGSGSVIYALRGNNTTDFWQYSTSTDSWSTTEFAPGNVSSGGSLVSSNSADEFFSLRGGGTVDFWKYTISTTTWTSMTDLPATVSDGAVSAYNATDEVIYVLRGGSTPTLWEYSISGDSWSTSLSDAPAGLTTGSSVEYVNSEEALYVLQGGTTSFWKYTIATDSWSTMAAAPGNTSLGADILYPGNGDYLYVFRGGSIETFWRYSISGNSWTSMSDAPGPVGTGASMVAPNGSTTVYAIGGGADKDFWEYNISTDVWSIQTDAPGNIGDGGSLLYPGSDVYLYALQGNSTSTFWRFAFSPNYYASGLFESQILDTIGNTTFDQILWTVSIPSGTTFALKVRSSDDSAMSGASDWSTCTVVANGGDPTSGGCVTDGERYVQYYIAYTTTNSALSAILDEISITYSHYYRTATLESSFFNSEDPANVLGTLSWVEGVTLPPSTNIQIQLASAPDNGGVPGVWTNYLGPTDSSDYFDDGASGCSKNSAIVSCITLPTQLTDITNDQWFRYQVYISSDGSETPILEELSVQYIINTAPMVLITNTPAQDSSGDVMITYDVSDLEETSVVVLPAVDINLSLNEAILSSTDTADIILDGAYASNLPLSGEILVGTEIISYSGVSDGNTLTGIVRGAEQTRPTSHLANAEVFFLIDGDVSGDINTQAVGSDKNIYWHVEDTFSELYLSDAALLVIAIDGNAANQVGYQSAGLVLDTKDPILPSISIDSRLDMLTLSVSDDSATEMKLSNESDLSVDGENGTSGSWVNFAATVSWNMRGNGLLGETVYVQFRDVYGNISIATSATTPNTPDNVLLQDISNFDESEWQLFLSWGVVNEPSPGFAGYDIYISTEGYDPDTYTYVAEATIIDRLQNYYVDSGLDPNVEYYYRLVARDTAGNISNYNENTAIKRTTTTFSSDEGGLTPDGSSGSDDSGPVISEISVDVVTEDTVTISWTTDELSNSIVGYSSSAGDYTSQVGVATMATSHAVTITGLDNATTYYFEVISYDSLNNKGYSRDDNIQKFSTTLDVTAPTISNVFANPTDTKVGISWTTDESSTSQVLYGISESLDHESDIDGSFVAGHSVVLDGLEPQTLYYFKVVSVDSSGNEAFSAVNSFTTTASPGVEVDVTAPTISSVKVSGTTPSSVLISFNTSEAAMTIVEYGLTADYSAGETNGKLTNVAISHSIALINLVSSSEYNYKIYAFDEVGNMSVTSNGTFVTGVLGAADLAPLVSSVSIDDVTQSTAVISWETNKDTTSYLAYSDIAGEYRILSGITTVGLQHRVQLNGLVESKRYYFKIVAYDSDGRIAESSNVESYSFSTIGDVTSPIISNLSYTTTTNTLVIVWTTDEDATSSVEYGLTPSLGNNVTLGDETDTGHVVNITELNPNTLYYFKVVSQDSRSNRSESQVYSTTTEIVPGVDGDGLDSSLNQIETVRISDVTTNSAIISWKTSVASESTVLYGLSADNLVFRKDSTDKTSHKVELTDLVSNSNYFFKIEATFEENSVNTDIYSFLTKTPVQLFDLKVLDVGIHSAVVEFTTPEPSEIFLEYKNSKSGDENVVGSGNKVSQHRYQLEGLRANTLYTFQVKILDDLGQTSSISEQYSFKTLDDQVGPDISLIETSSSLVENGTDISVQSIISWRTDEPATSQILYSENIGENAEYSFRSEKKDDFVTKHIVVLNGLQTGKTYQFVVESIDDSSNVETSEPFVMLTPQEELSVFDLIFEALENTFGWLRNF